MVSGQLNEEACLLSQLLSLPLRSVRLPRSDALPPAQPVYACVLWLKGVGRFSRST